MSLPWLLGCLAALFVVGMAAAIVVALRGVRIVERSGRLVKGGTFLGLTSLRFTTVHPPAGGYLPGADGEVHLRVPRALPSFLGPLMGPLFVLALPLMPVVVLLLLVSRGLSRVTTGWRGQYGAGH